MFIENSQLLFVLVFLGGSVEICRSTEFVPVYMWGTENTAEPSPALQRISESSFKDALLEKIKSKPLVVVFAEETLSPEDFAQHDQNGGTPFKALRQFVESANVVYYPAVQNPIGAIKQLDRGVTEISVASLLRNFEVPKQETLIVDLNDARDDEGRISMLSRHDTSISKIFEELKAKGNVLAIYTAHHASWTNPEEVKHRSARSLLQEQNTTVENMKEDQNLTAEISKEEQKILENTPELKEAGVKADQNGILIDEKVLLMYFSSTPQVSDNGGQTYKPINLKSEPLVKDNNNINLTLSGDGKSYNFVITLQSDGYWVLTNITSGKEVFLFHDISAPFGFSYHCANTAFSAGQVILKLPGLQLQVFKSEKEGQVFGDAYDCVGFTSIPIWTGIIITFILLLILTFGITLMMDIRTMDKFDDAKGKTITINAE